VKGLIVVLVFLCIAFATYGEGQQENVNEITTVGMNGIYYEMAIALFEYRHPDITVRNLGLDITTGETITMDALVAAGKAPDMYVDFAGRAAKYKVVEYAQELTIDESVFVPYLLDWGRIDGNHDGKLYGVPLPLPGQAMVLNMDLLDAIGYKVPDRWTITDFTEMAMYVKAAGFFPTVLFAANPSGDYIWVSWFGSFGAQFYNADYTRCTLDTPEGLAAFQWLDTLAREYAPAGPQTITDDDALAIWQTGRVAAFPIRPSWIPGYMDSAVKSGIIDKPFRTLMVEMPRGPGVDGVPTIGAGNMIVVRKQTDKKKLALINEFVEIIASTEIQAVIANSEGFPTNLGVKSIPNTQGESVVQRVAAEYGWMDVGYAQPWYYEVRSLLPQILREMYAGNITAAQARDQFVAGTNAILSK
jgi:ABC-type glycerol-3-phosphate transport system substrate-binding protein